MVIKIEACKNWLPTKYYLFETAILVKKQTKKIDSKLIKYWKMKLKKKYLEARNILKNKRKIKKNLEKIEK